MKLPSKFKFQFELGNAIITTKYFDRDKLDTDCSNYTTGIKRWRLKHVNKNMSFTVFGDIENDILLDRNIVMYLTINNRDCFIRNDELKII